MSQFYKKLSEWKEHNLISQPQVDSIIAYEDSLPKTNWSQIGFVVLGVGTIALGIISLIAYNWAAIPAAVKLTVGFALLFFIAYCIYLPKFRNSAAAQDGLIALFSLHCFAMIGLIAQVYNLQGPGYQTGLFWSAITVIVVSYARHFFVPALWTLIFTGSFFSACLQWEPFKDQVAFRESLFLFLFGIIALGSRIFFKNSILQKCVTYMAIACGVLATLIGSISWGHSDLSTESFLKIAPQFVLAAFAAALVLFDKDLKKFVKTMLGILIILLLANLLLDAFGSQTKLIRTLIGIIGLFAWALAFYAENYRGMFNFMMVLIAIKIFEIFVQNASGLIATGVGLVSGGLVVIAAVYAWNQKRDVLESRLQELIK